MNKYLICFYTVILLSFHSFSQDTVVPFKPYGVIGGYFFGDAAYKMKSDSFHRGNIEYSNLRKNDFFFNIRRVYLSYDYFISPKFSTELVLTYEGATPVTSTRNIFVKYLNVKWKNVFKRTDFIFGQMATPTFQLMEKIWGYRSVEKTIADMRGIAPSSDLGFSVQGRLNEKESLGYNVTIANGSGIRPENDNYKKLYADFNAGLFNKKITADVNYSYEVSSASIHKYRHTYKAGLAYKDDMLTVGAEVFDDYLHGYTSITGTVPTDTLRTDESSVGYSLFVTRRIAQKFTVFARYDHFNPDAKFNNGVNYISPYDPNNETFFTAGIDFQPDSRVHIIPNVWYNHYHNKTEPAIAAGLSNTDIVARVTVHVVFK